MKARVESMAEVMMTWLAPDSLNGHANETVRLPISKKVARRCSGNGDDCGHCVREAFHLSDLVKIVVNI